MSRSAHSLPDSGQPIADQPLLKAPRYARAFEWAFLVKP
jgi:hypothetical protein